MTAFRSLFLIAGCVCALAFAAPAQAQEARPRSARAPVQPIDAVATHALPALDNAALEARYPQGPGPLRFAEPRAASIQPHADGTWERLDDDTMLWRLRVRSGGARSINLGFTNYHMPPGGELFLYAPGYASVAGPFTAADNAPHGELWTPIVPGEEVIIEVTVPADQQSALELTLGRVNHGFRPFRAASKSSGSCNVDVVCEEDALWRNQARAVGAYTLSPDDDGQILCTGVLVNNTAGDRRPYFLTAAHCGVTDSTAASMVVYWNYENSTCRSGSDAGGEGDGTLDEFTSSGAFHRASYSGPTFGIQGGPDFTLVELDAPIDVAYNVRFAGWNRGDDPPGTSVAIHHPQGEEKRISFDFDPATITSYLASDVTDAPTHLRIGNWEVGTTEPGSSGSPLFDPDGHVVGILSGGYAGCSIENPTEDNDEPDWYGRFARAWAGGGTRATSLRAWLDPLDVAPTRINGIDLEDDDVPPAPITDLTIEEVDADGVTLEWTATGDDAGAGTAALYEMRYSTAPIRDEVAFDTARAVSGLPAPQPPGTTEQFTVRGLDEDTPYHFALVARDNVNNASPIAYTTRNAVILAGRFTLQPSYPNPFRTATTVGFAVEESQRVRVDLYDALGRHVQRLYDDTPSPNNLQRIRIDAGSLASGVYFVHLVGEGFARTTQIVRAR